MELFGASYPFPLGIENKNSLQKAGGKVKGGRWVNVNHEDWSNPNWKVVPCEGRLVDRTTTAAKYTLFDTDVAVECCCPLDGVWTVQDRMNKRWEKRIDFLVNKDITTGKWYNVELTKLN